MVQYQGHDYGVADARSFSSKINLTSIWLYQKIKLMVVITRGFKNCGVAIPISVTKFKLFCILLYVLSSIAIVNRLQLRLKFNCPKI